MKKQLVSYLTFSKKELNGILVLFIILILILAFPYGYRLVNPPETYDFSRFQKEIKLFKESAAKKERHYASAIRDKIDSSDRRPEYFEFDPNTLSGPGWLRLGLSPRQIKVIRNYLAKRGRFFKPEDLKKIYSITERQYGELEPYIRIRSNGTEPVSNRKLPVNKREFSKNAGAVPTVELNSADSVMLDQLRGIGPAFASRIIRFRNRLGGFYRKEQLREVYGMDSLRYSQAQDQITVDGSLVKKININTATFDQLKGHPYLTYKQMNALIQNRRQHGNYSSAEDLRRVLILDEEIIRKIEPYLSFEP